MWFSFPWETVLGEKDVLKVMAYKCKGPWEGNQGSESLQIRGW